MGYTHYWTQRKNITALDWQDMQAAFVRILARAKKEGLRICGPDGTGAPEFGSECLAFKDAARSASAAESAWSAYEKMADKLIELLTECEAGQS